MNYNNLNMLSRLYGGMNKYAAGPSAPIVPGSAEHQTLVQMLNDKKINKSVFDLAMQSGVVPTIAPTITKNPSMVAGSPEHQQLVQLLNEGKINQQIFDLAYRNGIVPTIAPPGSVANDKKENANAIAAAIDNNTIGNWAENVKKESGKDVNFHLTQGTTPTSEVTPGPAPRSELGLALENYWNKAKGWAGDVKDWAVANPLLAGGIGAGALGLGGLGAYALMNDDEEEEKGRKKSAGYIDPYVAQVLAHDYITKMASANGIPSVAAGVTGLGNYINMYNQY